MTDATTPADEPGADEPTTEAEEQPFQNRAARRAKGKAKHDHSGHSAGHVHGRSGTVQGPRQYGNRRSG